MAGVYKRGRMAGVYKGSRMAGVYKGPIKRCPRRWDCRGKPLQGTDAGTLGAEAG